MTDRAKESLATYFSETHASSTLPVFRCFRVPREDTPLPAGDSRWGLLCCV